MKTVIKDDKVIINSVILNEDVETFRVYAEEHKNNTFGIRELYNIDGEISGFMFEPLESNLSSNIE